MTGDKRDNCFVHRFEDIIGNEPIKRFLMSAADSRNVPHAMILSGEAGIGKITMAGAFVQRLLCTDEDHRGCGCCRTCIQVRSGSHPDVQIVLPEKKTLGIEDIRRGVNDEAAVRPFASNYKVLIIPDADLMTDQAQNALLKTLEEPPSYLVIMLLASSADRFLDTILSRSVVLPMRLRSQEEMADILSDGKIAPGLIRRASAFSGGNPGKAIEFLQDPEKRERADRVFDLFRRLPELDTASLSAAAAQTVKEWPDIREFLVLFEQLCRDAAVSSAAKDTGLLRYIAGPEDLAAWKGHDPVSAVDIIQDTLKKLKANVNAEISIFLMLVRIREN